MNLTMYTIVIIKEYFFFLFFLSSVQLIWMKNISTDK